MLFENTILHALSILTGFDINFLMNALIRIISNKLFFTLDYYKLVRLTTTYLCNLESQFDKFIKATVTDVFFD